MDNEGIDEVGLSHSQAIQLFVKAVINRGGIPFEREAHQPNKTSIAAMQELVDGKGHSVESLNDGQNTGTDS